MTEPGRRHNGGWTGLTRRRFIGHASIGGALIAASTRFGPMLATAAPGEDDVSILNYVLTLERLEADFYSRGVEAGAVQGKALALVEPILKHEEDHVASISDLIEEFGGELEDDSFDYPSGIFDSEDRFLEAALELEELGVGAYHGQLKKISERRTLDTLVAIAAIESRHASALAALQNADSLPAPLERGRPRSAVLKQAQPFLGA